MSESDKSGKPELTAGIKTSWTATVHQIALCFDCGWRCENHINHKARKQAYAHAKKTGHCVTVETGLTTRYN